MKPKIIIGNHFEDNRGKVNFNNDFDASEIKRIYAIENSSIDFIRAWQGHKIEQRWFSAIKGSFLIHLIEVDNWELPSKNLPQVEYKINAENLDILHVPSGYISSIKALEEGSKLLVMADYMLGEINDEYRYEKDYFS